MLKQNELLKYLEPTIAAGREFPWESSAHYANWSAQTFYYVSHSTRLFALAAGRAPLNDNPVHNRLLSHLKEEKGHENLSSHDIKILGMGLDQFPELAATKCLYQTQYYWIEHISAYSFFGYLLALESLAVQTGPDVHARVLKAHGPKACGFLKVHTAEDVKHVQEVISWIEKMPKKDQEAIMENFQQTLSNYKSILGEICAAKILKSTNKAA
jgi:hypothetical protein